MANDFMRAYRRWLAAGLDPITEKELEEMKDDPKRIEKCFSGVPIFGTAGLRGIMTAGESNINEYTLMHATQALCLLINQGSAKRKRVVIACDSRHNSEFYAKNCAAVFAANGIETLLFPEPRPSPELAFSVLRLGCSAGVAVTASHNTREYNGYKVYWSDGVQLSPETALTVAEYMNSTDIFTDVKNCDFDSAVGDGKIRLLGKEADEAYISAVLSQSIKKHPVSVVYTPLFGTGGAVIPEILRRAGNDVTVTESQSLPNGDFPGLLRPNPEEIQTFDEAKKIAGEVAPDLIIATDPDADRAGIAVRTRGGEYQRLSGNQAGILLTEYIISALAEKDEMPSDPYIIKSIVTTETIADIAAARGIRLIDVPTGFKYIGEQVKLREGLGNEDGFLLGFEESCGYLRGSYVRDKDAGVASLLFCEMTGYYKSKGLTPDEVLDAIFKKYGYRLEGTGEIHPEGEDTAELIKRVTERIRKGGAKTIGGDEIIRVKDYLSGEITDRDGGVTPTGNAAVDMMIFETEHGSVIVRPSGTEPKIKLYFSAVGSDAAKCRKTLERYMSDPYFEGKE